MGQLQKILIVLFLGLTSVLVSASDVSGTLGSAFKNGNAGVLNKVFPVDTRIHLSISAVGIKAGNYSREQAVALLRKAFTTYKTVSFDIQSNPGAMRITWVVRRKAPDKRKVITLYVAVEKRNRKSVITSIRGG